MKPAHIAMLALVLVAGGCSKKEPVAEAKSSPATAQAPIEVKVARAIEKRLDQSLLVTGSLYPDETVTVSAEVPGRVSKIHADFGQSVRAGQVLVELDGKELDLQVQRSKAALAQALARIGLKPTDADHVPDTTPSIRQAEAALRDAEFKFNNARKLVESGDISQDRYQELQNQFRSRQAALDAARDDFRVALANIQALKAEVELAQKRLGDTVVRAPFDGAVSERMVSAGQYMKENTAMMKVVKTTPLRLRVDIPEIAAGAVRVGGDLVFTTDSAPGKEFHAVVRQLDPQLESQSRSLTAEARLTGAHANLRPGMFVQVRLVTAQATTAVMVPKESVYRIAGLTKVFTISGGKLVEHRITPGREWNDWVEAGASAIHAGDQVALSNLANLVNGAPATPVLSQVSSKTSNRSEGL